MKRILGILLTVALFVALLVPVIQYLHIPVYAQELEVGQEVVEQRTQSTKTHYIGDGIYSTEAALWPIHYQDSGWQEIDNAWVTATAPWNWEMTHDSYHAYALNQFTYGQILKFELEGESVAFQPMNLQWTNDLSQIQSISIPQNVPVEVTNEPIELLTGMEGSIGSIRWNNAYGTGRHFEFTTTPGKLQTLLQLDAVPPEPSEYIINGGNPVMRQSFILAPSADLVIYVNGVAWDKKTKVQTVNDIEFRLDGETVWYFWQAKYWDSGNSTGIATTVLRKVGNDLWLDVLVPYEWLQTAVYPIFIDPDTGATYPGLGSNEDYNGKTAWINSPNIEAEAGVTYNSIGLYTYSDWLRASDFGFAIPSGATIVGVKVEINRRGDTADKLRDHHLYLVGASGENGFGKEDIYSYYPIVAAIATYGGATSAYDYWYLTLTPAVVNNANFGIRLSVFNEDLSHFCNAFVYWVKITVYYAETPTVTTQAATNVQATTARLNGQISDDGGDACQYRFRYKKSGGSYSYTSWAGAKTTGQTFYEDIGSLDKNSLYYFNAQAKNSNSESDWGSELNFTTLTTVPTVDTDACSDEAAASIEGHADITDGGGATVTRRGFVHAEGIKYALDFNGVSDYVEIPYLADYYANTAAVETFEWGIKGTSLGVEPPLGSVDWTISVAGTSKADIETDANEYYAGTRSGRLYRDGTNTVQARFTQAALTSGQSLELWVRKDGTSRLQILHGDSAYAIQTYIEDDEHIMYYDGAVKDTGSTVSINTWYLLSIRNVNWVAHTYDIYLSNSLIQSGATMRLLSSVNGVIAFQNDKGTSEVWLDNILVSSPSVWTWETWINRKVDSGTYETIMRYIGDAEVTDRFIQISATDIVQSGFLDTTGTNRYVETIDTIPLNTETHLGTTFDGTFIKIYFDGVLKATSADLSAYIPRNNKLPIKIGKMLASYSGLDGTQDEFRIWEDVRTQTEIQANMYAELDGDEAGLVGYWKLNEGTLTTAEDSTSNENDGTITGADWVYQSWDLTGGGTQIIYSYSFATDGDFPKVGVDYPTIWSATTCFADTGSFIQFGQSFGYAGPPDYWLFRAFIFFDTSSIPAGAVIKDASINLYGRNDNSDSDFLIVVQNGQPTYPHNPVVAGDYNKDNYWGEGGGLSSSEWTTSGYNIINLNSDGKSWINRGGITKFFIRSSIEIAGIAPTGNEYVGAFASEESGTSKDPYLGITYHSAYEDGSFGEGEYNLTIEDLTPETWYRVRAFAENSVGIGYGDVVVAETLTILLPPTNLAATDGIHIDKVVVTWTKSDTATGYKVYENGNLLDTVGDVATWDDTTAPAPTIIAGTAAASDGTSTLYVILTLTGASANNGASRTYKATAIRGAEESDYSNTDEGYRTVGALTFQWQRSAIDSDDNYSNIGGATTVPYNDIGSPAPTITPGTASASDGTSSSYVTVTISGHSGNDGDGKYFQCVLNADGAAEQTSTTDRGYRGTTTLTFEWFRSTADSDTNFSSIAGEGGTTNPFNDYNGAIDPDGRYYYAKVSMVGAITQITTHDRGYILIVILLPFPPTNLIAIQTSLDSMNVTWSMGVSANYTILRIKVDEYPSDITDGEELYYGNFTGTAYNLTYIGVNPRDVEIYNLDSRAYYIRAWSENDNGYSIDYAETRIGGKMIIIAILAGLAFGMTMGWVFKRQGFLAWGGAGAWLLCGFASMGESASPSPAEITDIYMGLFWLCIGFTLVCAILPFATRERVDEGSEDLIKGIEGEDLSAMMGGGEEESPRSKKAKPSKFSRTGQE